MVGLSVVTTRDSKTRNSEGNVASVREKYEMLYINDTPHYLGLKKHMHSSFQCQKSGLKFFSRGDVEINRFLKSKNENDKAKNFTHKD